MAGELINDPRYWKRRLREAPRGERHHAIFRCPLDRWRRIEAKHKILLERHVGPTTSVLDCGCAWGRLLTLMPDDWCGDYLGVDISPDFVALAREEHPLRRFVVADLRGIDQGLSGSWAVRLVQGFDLAVLISIRPMVRRNQGDEVWAKMEAEIRRWAGKLLYLEYDENDEGSLE